MRLDRLDKTTKDSEIVADRVMETYFAREVYPHVPDAHYWFDGKGYGAEIPLLAIYHYQHQKMQKALQSLWIEAELQTLLEELNMTRMKEGIDWIGQIAEEEGKY